MSRLFYTGFETAHDHAEGLTAAGAAVVTYDTGWARSGSRSIRFAGAGTAATRDVSFVGAVGTTYWLTGWFRVGSAPSANCFVAGIFTAAGAAPICQFRINSLGNAQLTSGAALFGSNGPVLAANTTYRFDLACRVGVGATDYIELWIDGASVASGSTQTITDSAPGLIRFGVMSNATLTIAFDDLIFQNSGGSVNNTIPGDDKVVLLLPTADAARDAGWLNGAAGTTNLYDAVNNIPPAGTAVTVSTATSAIENAVSTTTQEYDATMQTYSAAGLVSGDTVTAVYGVIEGCSSSTTGSDTIGTEIESNPAIAEALSSVDASAGAYPTSWIRGQTTIAENPTVTLGTAPVMSVRKNIAATRVHTVCLMAMYVSYTEAGVAPTPVSGSDTQGVDETETGAPAASLTLADTQSISRTETASIAASLNLADTQGISQSETRTLSTSLPGSDTQGIGASESSSLAKIEPKSGSDTQGISIGDEGIPWTPAIYGAELALWIDPDEVAGSDGDQVADFTEESPNGLTVDAYGVPAGGNAPPTIEHNEVNGHKAIRFSGFQGLRVNPGISGDQFTVIQVWRRTNAIGAAAKDDYWTSVTTNNTFSTHGYSTFSSRSYDMMVSYHSNPSGAGNYVLREDFSANTDPHIIAEVWNRADSYGSFDGETWLGDPQNFGDGTDLTGADISDGIDIGSDMGTNGSTPFLSNMMEGDLLGFAILNYVASQEEVEWWEGFYSHRFAIPLASGHPYENDPPLILSGVVLATLPGSDTQGIDEAENGNLVASVVGADGSDLWTPEEMVAPITWGKADDLIGTLTDGHIFADTAVVLPDASGQGHPLYDHLGGGNITFQTNEINGLPVIRGDATSPGNCEIDTGNIAGLQPSSVSVAMVVKNLPTNVDLWSEDEQEWIVFKQGTAVKMYAGTQQTIGTISGTGPHIIVTVFDGANSIGSVDGTASGFVNVGAGAPNYAFDDFRFSINNGAWMGVEFIFDLGETIVEDGAWTLSRVQEVEGYLSQRWGVTLASGHPYENIPPIVAIGSSESSSVSVSLSSSDTQGIDETEAVVSIVETAAKSGSDTQDVSQAESQTINTALASSDTQGIDEAESPALLAAISNADTQGIDETEASSLTYTFSGSDSQGVSATEVGALVAGVSGSDTQGIDETEVIASLIANLPGSDTQAIGATEGATFDETANKSGSDTQDITQSESASLAASLSVSDTQIIGVTEAGQPEASLPGSDTQPVSATDAASLSATVSASDTQGIVTTDSGALTIAVPGSDTQPIDDAETSTQSVLLSGSDTQGVDDTDTILIDASLAGVDTQAIDDAETHGVTQDEIPVYGTDVQPVSAMEGITLSASVPSIDTQGVSQSESVALSAFLSSADTQGIDESESGDISLSVFEFTDDDAQSVSATEGVSLVAGTSAADSGSVASTVSVILSASLSGSEATPIGGAESAEVSQPAIGKSGEDSQGIAASEIRSLQATIARSDTSTLILTDGTLLSAAITRSDTQAISRSESSFVAAQATQKTGSDTRAIGSSVTARVGISRLDTSSLVALETRKAISDAVPPVANVIAGGGGLATPGVEGGVYTVSATGKGLRTLTGIGYPPTVANND